MTAHELGHRIVPWHAGFLIGDTFETLAPDYHELIEAEANFAASTLLFLASRFSKESNDYKPNITSVLALSKIYGNSKTVTLRRYVQHGNDKPMVAVISKPHWSLAVSEDLCQYFVPSKKFSKSFSKITPHTIMQEIVKYTFQKSGGPVGGGEFILMDDNGHPHEFIGDSFFNTYDILTLIVHKRPYPSYDLI